MDVDPRRYRISKHFVLSDFLGNNSVYTRGHANPFVFDKESGAKLENLHALCHEALEPLLTHFGPLSISYGYICPDLSRRIVKYQDPDKPSHHRFDLGAACDFISHNWVEGDFKTIVDLYAPKSAMASPIALAHAIDYLEIPYSRLITYSESPYICLAVSAREVVADQPRKAFYENRYQGKAKEKPEYLQYSTLAAKTKALRMLQEQGLERDWRGAGYPTYHGGGTRQLHHTRVSKHSMLSDFLFDLQSISNGAKNVPAMNLDAVQDAFAAAGIVYDFMLDTMENPRLSIVAGYVSHLNPYFDAGNDWRGNEIAFSIAANDGTYTGFEWGQQVEKLNEFGAGTNFKLDDGVITVTIDVDEVLTSSVYPTSEQLYE